MAKYDPNSKDPYQDAESGILKNLVGATDQETLDQIESGYTYLRQLELSENPVEGNFDLRHLQAMHKRLFGDVYAWAGEIRTVDISKGDTRFAHSDYIESAAVPLFKQLKNDRYYANQDADTFSKKAGELLGEINVLHPFREGNGRTQREFISQLAAKSGYQINWHAMTREEMTTASIEAYRGNSARLASMIRNNLLEPEHEHAKAMAIREQGIGADMAMRRAEQGGEYRGRVIGANDRYVVQELTSDKTLVLHSRKTLSGQTNFEAFSAEKQSVAIRYPHGSAGLVKTENQLETAMPARKLELSRDRDFGIGKK